MTLVNTQCRLAARPVGLPKPTDWTFIEEPVPSPADGEFLVRVEYLSMDPAMRTWMNAGRSYVPPVGDRRSDACRWDRTRHRVASPGLRRRTTRCTACSGFSVTRSRTVAASPRGHHARACPGAPRCPGHRRPDRVLRAARHRQARAGSDRRRLGRGRVGGQHRGPDRPDQGLPGDRDRRRQRRSVAGSSTSSGSTPPSTTRPAICEGSCKTHAPNGVDVFFDNVGGEALEAALARLARGARVVLCGADLAVQRDRPLSSGPANYMQLLVTRASMTGFVIFDYARPLRRRRCRSWRSGCAAASYTRASTSSPARSRFPGRPASGFPRREHRQAGSGGGW